MSRSKRLDKARGLVDSGTRHHKCVAPGRDLRARLLKLWDASLSLHAGRICAIWMEVPGVSLPDSRFFGWGRGGGGAAEGKWKLLGRVQANDQAVWDRVVSPRAP